MKQHLQRQLLLLLCAIATGWTAAWAQATTVVWEKVTDYSQLSTSDTYVIAGSGISGGTTVWYSLKNNHFDKSDIKSKIKGLSVGQELTIQDDKITNSVTDDETWELRTTDTEGEYYIKSTKGNYYLHLSFGSS